MQSRLAVMSPQPTAASTMMLTLALILLSTHLVSAQVLLTVTLPGYPFAPAPSSRKVITGSVAGVTSSITSLSLFDPLALIQGTLTLGPSTLAYSLGDNGAPLGFGNNVVAQCAASNSMPTSCVVSPTVAQHPTPPVTLMAGNSNLTILQPVEVTGGYNLLSQDPTTPTPMTMATPSSSTMSSSAGAQATESQAFNLTVPLPGYPFAGNNSLIGEVIAVNGTTTTLQVIDLFAFCGGNVTLAPESLAYSFAENNYVTASCAAPALPPGVSAAANIAPSSCVVEITTRTYSEVYGSFTSTLRSGDPRIGNVQPVNITAGASLLAEAGARGLITASVMSTSTDDGSASSMSMTASSGSSASPAASMAPTSMRGPTSPVGSSRASAASSSSSSSAKAGGTRPTAALGEVAVGVLGVLVVAVLEL